MNETPIKKTRVKKKLSKPVQPIEGAGLLHDVFVKPFKADKKVKQLTGDAALYSKLANEAYKRTDAADTIDGFTKDNTFSQINAVIYTNMNNRSIVMAIRGTDPKNISDLATDLSVATGTLKASKRYRDISELFNKVYAKYGKYIGKSLLAYKYIIAGHSMGSSLSLQLLLDNPDKIDSIYLYNSGSSVDTVKKGIQMKIGKALGIGYYKKVSKKINIYRVAGDPISIGSRFLNGSYTDVQSSKLDRHGMANFLPKDEPSKPTIEPTIAVQTGPRKPSWSYSRNWDPEIYGPNATKKPDPNLADLKVGFGGKPVDLMIKKPEVKAEIKPEIKSNPVENTTNEKEQQQEKTNVGSGIGALPRRSMNKNKNKILSSNKTMDVDNMSKKQMIDVIRNNKQYKRNLSGYSKMAKEELRANLKKAMNGEVVSKRVSGKPSPWLEALKKWNEGKATYSIPKKGTADHEAVLALMKAEVVVVDKPVKSKRSKVVAV